MSTIASPRDPLRRLPSATPTSSARPSLDAASPGGTSQPQPPKRSKRAALREYYNLRAAPRIELPDSEVPSSHLDAPDFNAAEYVDGVVSSSGLEHLLRLYTQVVSEVRALDAEKKALVYDNYSKLISATETIRKMRANMDPLNPMASTLDPAIAQIYSQASSIREAVRDRVPPPDSDLARRRKTRELAAQVLAAPQQLRDLAKQGRMDEARRQWELPRRLLVSWKEKGLGGQDVQACIDEGDAALRPTRDAGSDKTPKNHG